MRLWPLARTGFVHKSHIIFKNLSLATFGAAHLYTLFSLFIAAVQIRSFSEHYFRFLVLIQLESFFYQIQPTVEFSSLTRYAF